MAFGLGNLKRTTALHAPIWINYGVDGIGKTTMAGEFAGPDMTDAIYVPTEGEEPPSGLELDTPGTIKDWWDSKDLVSDLLKGGHSYKWLIFDALDGFEPILWKRTCERMGWSDIETPGFGKGYLAADEEWSEFMEDMGELRRAGMGVILLAHPEIVKFESPVTDPYNRYTLKLNKRGNALVREQSNIVSFMNYRVNIKEKEVARQKSVSHAEGGKVREVHFSTNASWDAKNRYDMPDSIVYKKGKAVADIGKYFPEPLGVE